MRRPGAPAFPRAHGDARQVVRIGDVAAAVLRELDELGAEALVTAIPALADRHPFDRDDVLTELEVAGLVEAEALEDGDARLRPSAPGRPK